VSRASFLYQAARAAEVSCPPFCRDLSEPGLTFFLSLLEVSAFSLFFPSPYVGARKCGFFLSLFRLPRGVGAVFEFWFFPFFLSFWTSKGRVNTACAFLSANKIVKVAFFFFLPFPGRGEADTVLCFPFSFSFSEGRGKSGPPPFLVKVDDRDAFFFLFSV